ncbi:MAG: squalene cyclase [Desulfovibrio sp.]|nr:squalene cyclase [Desulfovibrio sp.]
MEKYQNKALGLTHHFSHDNLHIAVDEQFDHPQADALMEILRGNQARCKRIFVDVRKVAHSRPSAVAAFKSSLRAQVTEPGRLFFKGMLGFDLGINGNRVLIVKKAAAAAPKEKKHVCKGNCSHCTCGHR